MQQNYNIHHIFTHIKQPNNHVMQLCIMKIQTEKHKIQWGNNALGLNMLMVWENNKISCFNPYKKKRIQFQSLPLTKWSDLLYFIAQVLNPSQEN